MALERIEDGTFGECEICGGSISLKHLEARPVTAKCFDCKEAEERRRRFTNNLVFIVSFL